MRSFSVVIPTYNHAPLLRRCLASVLAQTHTAWEAIVINNYSEDDTIEVVASFADPRISLVNFHNHGVIAASRNQGIARAAQSFVAFLDSDDCWRPGKLAAVARALEQDPEADVVYHDEMRVDLRGNQRRLAYGAIAPPAYRTLLIKGNQLSTSATVVRRELAREVGGFSEEREFITAEDYEFWLKLARAGARFHYLPEVLGEFRVGHPSATGNIERHTANVTNVVERHLREMAQQGELTPGQLQRLLASRRAIQLYSAGRAHHAAGRRGQACRLLLSSLRQRPLWAKPYAGLLLALLPRPSA